jgi:hypothetical protein
VPGVQHDIPNISNLTQGLTQDRSNIIVILFHSVEIIVDSVDVGFTNWSPLALFSLLGLDLLRFIWIKNSFEATTISMLDHTVVKHLLNLASHGFSNSNLLLEILDLDLHGSHLGYLLLELHLLLGLRLLLFLNLGL